MSPGVTGTASSPTGEVSRLCRELVSTNHTSEVAPSGRLPTTCSLAASIYSTATETSALAALSLTSPVASDDLKAGLTVLSTALNSPNLDSVSMFKLELLLLEQFLLYRQVLLCGPLNVETSTQYRQSLARLVAALPRRSPDENEDETQAKTKHPSLSDDGWKWNPFPQATTLVMLLEEELALRSAANSVQDLTELLELLGATFEIGPPRSRAELSDAAIKTLTEMYLHMAFAGDKIGRSVGRALAHWVYNNESGKGKLRQTLFEHDNEKRTFLEHLGRLEMSAETAPSCALLVQNWVCGDEELQREIVDSLFFTHPCQFFSSTCHKPLLSLNSALMSSARRLCVMVREVHPGRHATTSVLAGLAASVAELFVRCLREMPLQLVCAQLLLELKSHVKLSPGAESEAITMIASFPKSKLAETLRPLVNANIRPMPPPAGSKIDMAWFD
ncbi:hypothetical protein CAOG_07421 [Capsaspora owczarzaki ATCC 30864]|uniref:Uncharacterized protein n=1 Tax=Capsaspora owczarzaki (strain ATCC 30864) TaxID=595528 RepID=A0A0D2URJ3_CAPO3|nr:hypothetical protein CAOG_07421 [Capsaspora owczarzaki ATCC 30864]KJE97591.1 hypothetical protein CAOG_007421 [Capsaspora owczarzaki ATCC 30864]|eukprot:XP_004343280.1 hypothetical protein CAOG_07421 [Capsaspora owczarzaki ATCC 30864]